MAEGIADMIMPPTADDVPATEPVPLADEAHAPGHQHMPMAPEQPAPHPSAYARSRSIGTVITVVARHRRAVGRPGLRAGDHRRARPQRRRPIPIAELGIVGPDGGGHGKAIAARDAGADVLIAPTEERPDVDEPGLEARGARDVAHALDALLAA